MTSWPQDAVIINKEHAIQYCLLHSEHGALCGFVLETKTSCAVRSIPAVEAR